MCTLSWIHTSIGYHVFFNRDEQKTRLKAELPSVHQTDGVKSIMPIDPQGEGTWISVNEYGVTFALLNFYQGVIREGTFKSRGQLVKRLCHVSSKKQLHALLDSCDLRDYAPFSLLCLIPDEQKEKCLNSPEVVSCWTGEEHAKIDKASPIISSAVNFERVEKCRLVNYEGAVSADGSEEKKLSAIKAFHRSHWPNASEYSTCMHRDDAETVSYSHIFVPNEHADTGQITFDYVDGSPCSPKNTTSLNLNILRAIT